MLRDIFSFLGVDPEQAIDLSRRHNETVVPRFPALHKLRRRIFGERSLIGWVPARSRRVVRHLASQRRPSVTMDPHDRRMVIDYYRDEILRTADLIGRDLSAWLESGS
jgi:hypothetical protein